MTKEEWEQEKVNLEDEMRNFITVADNYNSILLSGWFGIEDLKKMIWLMENKPE